jgi:hypothetical protein
MTEHGIQGHFISSSAKIKKVPSARKILLNFLGLSKRLADKICQFSSVHWNIKEPTTEDVSNEVVSISDFVPACNARLHTARTTLRALETLMFEVLSHLPGDFCFSHHRDLKGTHITSDDEVKQVVMSWIRKITP